MVPELGVMRAYFGPVQKATGGVTVFDAERDGRFDPAGAPPGWIGLGSITDLKRTAATKYTALRAGTREQTEVQVRVDPDAKVSLQFREWGKLQLALASGSQHMNLLLTAKNGAPAGSGGVPLAAVYVLAGSTAQVLQMAAGDAAGLSVGDVLAVDVDYAQQTGYVGTGIPCAYVAAGDGIARDGNFVRRMTFNVAKVAAVNGGAVTLEEALAGGAPAVGAGVQKVAGYVDREGGSYFQEWSGLFVADGAQGDRVCFYYPRLQAMAGAEETTHEGMQTGLAATFRALPTVDGNDGETVLCYRSYLPGSGARVY